MNDTLSDNDGFPVHSLTSLHKADVSVSEGKEAQSIDEAHRPNGEGRTSDTSVSDEARLCESESKKAAEGVIDNQKAVDSETTSKQPFESVKPHEKSRGFCVHRYKQLAREISRDGTVVLLQSCRRCGSIRRGIIECALSKQRVFPTVKWVHVDIER